jgi:exosortase A-associated hydrolase 2
LFVPALAEEQNKARHVVSAVARRLAGQGISVLLLDPSGTGDSEGEFADVKWPDWVDDLEVGLDWLRARSDAPLVVWAMRGGALLSAMLVTRAAEKLHGLMLWNPVLRGAQIASELSRRHSVSAMLGGAASRQDQVTYHNGARPIEIGGYCWSPDLLAGLKPMELATVRASGLQVRWLDVAREPARAPAPAVRKALEALHAGGAVVEYRAVPGVNFWSNVELEWPGGLMEATVESAQSLLP